MARKNFRKAVKAAQNSIIYTKYKKMNKLKRSDPRKFWENVRGLKESSLKRPFTINNKQSNEDIVNEFGDHFNTLLNNPKGSATCKNRPLPDSTDEVFIVTTEDVDRGIEKLKTNKSKDPFNVLAEHVIHAKNEILTNHIRDILNIAFQDKVTPPPLAVATLIPLVKSYRKSLKSGNNYRGISLIPIMTKIMEYIILNRCPELKNSCNSQFGFKKESSTLHAEFLISETLHHYNKNGSSVYMCSLDAEKAFDSCNWDILFQKLYTMIRKSHSQ